MLKNNHQLNNKKLYLHIKLFSTITYLGFPDKEDTAEIIQEENQGTSNINQEGEYEEYTPNTEYRKTYYKNDLRKQVLKQNFDNEKMFTDENIHTERDKLCKEQVDTLDERKQLKFDLKAVRGTIKGLEDMAANKIPKKKEFQGYSHVVNNYHSFLDDENTSNISGMKDVKDYIKTELAANKNRSKELKNLLNEEQKSEEKSLKRKLDELSDVEESGRSSKSTSVDESSVESTSESTSEDEDSVESTNEDESNVKSTNEDENSVESTSDDRDSVKSVDEESGQSNKSSVKSSSPTNDYIDSLPDDHNPFDDLGTD